MRRGQFDPERSYRFAHPRLDEAYGDQELVVRADNRFAYGGELSNVRQASVFFESSCF